MILTGLFPFGICFFPLGPTSHETEGITKRKREPIGSRFFLVSNIDYGLIIRKALVVSHHQVAVDFLDEVEGDADDDEQAGAAEEAGDLHWDVHFC